MDKEAEDPHLHQHNVPHPKAQECPQASTEKMEKQKQKTKERMEVSFSFLVCLVELPFQIKIKVEKCNEKKETIVCPTPPLGAHLSQVLSLASSDPNLFFFFSIQQIELSSDSSLLFAHQEQHTLPKW